MMNWTTLWDACYKWDEPGVLTDECENNKSKYGIEEEDEQGNIVLASGEAIKDADSKDDITAALVAETTGIANAQTTARRLKEDEEL